MKSVIRSRLRFSWTGRLHSFRARSSGRVRPVLRLAIPSAGEQLLSMMVGIVNTFLVGHLGASSLAAVGLANQWIMMAMVFFSAIGTGATALIARMVGAGKPNDANRVLRQALLIAVTIGVLCTIPAILLAEPAMRLMGAEPEAVHLGGVFMRIASSVFLFSSVMFVGNACMRGAGDTRTPMAIMAVVNTINIIVAWSLINGSFGLPQLGVAGSALGAFAGRMVGGILVFWLLWRGRNGLTLKTGTRWLEMPLIRRIVRVGIPTAMELMIFRFGMMSFTRTVAALGTVAIAAHQVALNAESLSFMPGFGFAVAATTLVGQGLGAKEPERSEKDAYTAFFIAMLVMSLMGVVFLIFARPLISFFTTDMAVIDAGITPLRLVALAQPFLAASMVFAGSLRGAGDTRTPMLINGLSIWVLRVPLALLLTQLFGLGLTGAWLAMSIDLSLRGGLLFGRFRLGRWKTVRV